jgi:protein O-mannosyl-transferase
MRRCGWEIMIVLLLVGCTALVFRGGLRADFVRWDDDILIYDNPHLTGLNAPTVRWMFTAFDYVVRYQPLTWLTWAAIAQWAGRNPAPYHLASLVFHALNACLVFLLIRELLLRTKRQMVEPARAKYSALCAGAATLLWAVHPMRVEAVAWASALLHCQALFFVLTATLFYLKVHAPSGSPKQQRACYTLSVVAFAASLLSYPIALGFVIVLILLDWRVLRRFPPGAYGWRQADAKRVWLEKLPFLGVAVVVLGITIWARLNVSDGWVRTPALAEFGIGHRMMQACYIWAYYLWKPCVPFDLCPVYTTLLSFRPTDAAFGYSLMLLLVVTAVLVARRRRWAAAGALWIAYLILLVPVLGLTEHPHYPSDRYSYMVSILLSLAVAGGLYSLAHRPGQFVLGLAACVALVGFFGVLSARQTRIWRNSETLFRYTIAQLGSDPYRADVLWRLGMALADQQQLDEAVASYRAALSISPELAEAHHHLAIALERQQKGDEALEHYQTALRLMPDYAEAHSRLGFLLAERGRKDEAIAHLQRALALDPRLADVREKLGALQGGSGK